MIPDMIDNIVFEVDGIEYHHPFNLDGRRASVTVRPIIQFRPDSVAAVMNVYGNKPKLGLMDSEVNEQWVKEFWG